MINKPFYPPPYQIVLIVFSKKRSKTKDEEVVKVTLNKPKINDFLHISLYITFNYYQHKDFIKQNQSF